MLKETIIEIDVFVYTTGVWELVLFSSSNKRYTRTGSSKAAAAAKLPKDIRDWDTSGAFQLKKTRDGSRVHGEWWTRVE